MKMYAMPPRVGEGERSDDRYRTGLGLRSPETIEAQLVWLSALWRETDLTVPEPVSLPDGSLVGEVSFADLPPLRTLRRRVSTRHRELYPPNQPPWHFVLLRWVPGEREEDPTAADPSRVGRLAAALHDHAEGYRPPDASALPRRDWCWPFGASAPLWGEGEAFYSSGGLAVFGEASRRVRENLLFGGPDASPRQTVGTADFGQCGLGHYLFALVVLLRTLGARWRCAGSSPELSDERVLGSLLAGYKSARGLPPDDTPLRHCGRHAEGGRRQRDPGVARLSCRPRGARGEIPAPVSELVATEPLVVSAGPVSREPLPSGPGVSGGVWPSPGLGIAQYDASKPWTLRPCIFLPVPTHLSFNGRETIETTKTGEKACCMRIMRERRSPTPAAGSSSVAGSLGVAAHPWPAVLSRRTSRSSSGRLARRPGGRAHPMRPRSLRRCCPPESILVCRDPSIPGGSDFLAHRGGTIRF